MAQTVKHLPTRVQSLGWEDLLEKEMAPTPVFLPGEFHGQRNLVRLQSMGLQSQTRLTNFTFTFNNEEDVELVFLRFFVF